MESIEVITGIPSVEYGDLTSGVVKVKTRKGKTPYTATFTTNPKTKQFSLSKGFDLGRDLGSLNVALEHTRAIDNPVSPYTTYQRNGIALNYARVFRRGSTPLNFSVGLTGNLGGMNTKDDPDAQTGEWKKAHDNALRFNTSLDWLLNKSWITNVAVTASVNYADMLSKYHLPVHTASEQPAVNATTEGYFVANQLPVNYVNTQFIDSKELDYGVSLKANWSRRFDRLLNRVKAGVTWSANGNVGQGEYYENPQLQPNGFRPRPYTDIPYMHNLAVYLEDNLTLQLGQTSLGVMAGVRGEKTLIKNMQYDKAPEPVAAIQCEIYADQSRTEIFSEPVERTGRMGNHRETAVVQYPLPRSAVPRYPGVRGFVRRQPQRVCLPYDALFDRLQRQPAVDA